MYYLHPFGRIENYRLPDMRHRRCTVWPIVARLAPGFDQVTEGRKMENLRLAWEPESSTSLKEIEDRMLGYTKGRGGVSIMANGTLLFLRDSDDVLADARRGLDEARFIVDFLVVPLKEGGYMVKFHDAVAVFVGAVEFNEKKKEIAERQSELMFPGEVMISSPGQPAENMLVGLYARGKLQRDAYCFSLYKRL